MKPIPIAAARDVAEKYDYDQIYIIGRKTGENGGEHLTTYGVTEEHCTVAALAGEALKWFMRWNNGQWHATAELAGAELELTLYYTDHDGPMKEWKPVLTFPTDEAHATELLGTLALALEKKRSA